MGSSLRRWWQKVMQSTHEFAIGWQQLEINRSLVKRPVMTLPIWGDPIQGQAVSVRSPPV